MRMDEIPIYAGLAILVVLVFDRRLSICTAWLWIAVPLAFSGLFLPHILARLGSENYNLAEMFRQDRSLPGVRLAMLCLLTPFAVSCSASVWISGSRLRALCWVPASCLVTWGILRRAVTVESVQDILGAPVLNWPADLEYIIRLSVVYLSFVWIPIFLTIAFRRSRRLVVAVVYSVGLVVASAVIVNGYTPSDNVPEIFREHGHPWFAATCLLAPWAAILCRKAYSRFGTAAAIATIGLSSALASVMLDKAVLLSDIHGLQVGFATAASAFAVAVVCIIPARTDHPTIQH